jgi:homoserine O-acetyltransferase/O-succinyltransferase
MVLDDLGVRQIAAVVGGSMGGMLVLEYAYFGRDHVRTIVPIATSSRHSAWGISWGEAQRQSIYCDPQYGDGNYLLDEQPTNGLAAARMSALLTYRSRDSFERRFGRNPPEPSRKQNIHGNGRPPAPPNERRAVHDEGHRKAGQSTGPGKTRRGEASPDANGYPVEMDGISAATSPPHPMIDPQFRGTEPPCPAPAAPAPLGERKRATTHFSAQSYLRYQGQKFVARFDSNCYIAITQKLDTHDVSRQRIPPGTPDAVRLALSQITQPTLVLGIKSDGLFTFAEQQELADWIPNARLKTIDSPEGHDAFLLQFEQVNQHILDFFRDVLPDIMGGEGGAMGGREAGAVGTITKSSLFGEAEVEEGIAAC